MNDEDDLAVDDWFGDGSAFDSGEELAAALMALAGTGAAGGGAVPSGRGRADWLEDDEPLHDSFEAVTRPSIPGQQVPDAYPSEFQVAAMPSRSASASLRDPGSAGRWNVRPGSDQAQRTGWAIRQSVQILKTTEDIIRRIREEAIEVSWRAAAVAVVEGDVDPPRAVRRAQKRAARAAP